MCPPHTNRSGDDGGPSSSGAHRARGRAGTRTRSLAVAMVRELRARGWSYREIGSAFAGERSVGHAYAPGLRHALAPARLLTPANATKSAAADHRMFLQALDLVGEGLAFFDAAGTLLHTNRALDFVLEDQGGGVGLADEIFRFAQHLASRARAEKRAAGEPLRTGELERREVHLPDGDFRLRGSYLSLDLFGLGATVLVALDQHIAPASTDEALHARFGLSRQQSRITRLLARGRSNAEIAADLGISPHTARRHTERIFSKLRVRSRAEVAPRLHDFDKDVTGNR